MSNAVLTTPEVPFESRGLDKKVTLWERLRKGDEVAHLITLAGGWSILVITALLVQHLWVFSRLSRHAFGWHFLVDSTWDPVNGHFGAWPFVYGTVVTSLLALAISIPIGIGSAIFLAELAPRKLSNGLTFLIELLAAVPSVIYGLIGIFLLIPFLFNVVPYFQKFFGWIPIFNGTFYGVSYFSASVVLVDHGGSVHHFDFTRGPHRRPGGSTRSHDGPGCDQVGRHLARRGSVCSTGNHGFHLPFTGPRIGRNHGGHHGDWECGASIHVTDGSGLHHCRGYRE